jgi:hypothetical protein
MEELEKSWSESRKEKTKLSFSQCWDPDADSGPHAELRDDGEPEDQRQCEDLKGDQ